MSSEAFNVFIIFSSRFLSVHRLEYIVLVIFQYKGAELAILLGNIEYNSSIVRFSGNILESYITIIRESECYIDFYEAQTLWGDPHLIEIPVQMIDEPRYLVVGTIEGKHWSGVIAYRGDKVGIISVRQSRNEEVEISESEST
jgi:uncharacterized protein